MRSTRRNNSFLDAVAHGGDQRQSSATGNPSTTLAPQDRAASLFQAPRFIDGVTDN